MQTKKRRPDNTVTPIYDGSIKIFVDRNNRQEEILLPACLPACLPAFLPACLPL